MNNKFFKVLIIFCFIAFVVIIIFMPICFLKLSFKTNYVDIIENQLNVINNKTELLNTNFILSIIKAESNFNSEAQSNKDAFGLMQLTLLTAREMAEKLNFEISKDDLFNPEINIKLGINYLNYLFSQKNDKQLVLMCYNAGINRVNTWLENGEIKVENGLYVCPFKETTDYIKKVINNEKIYNKFIRK